MTFGLRYYVPEEPSDANFGRGLTDREKVARSLALLEQIELRHGIKSEVVQLKCSELGPGQFFVDIESERDVYKHDFIPRATVLKRRVGASLTRTLRSRRGHLYLSHVVAVVENGSVGWFTCYQSCQPFRELMEDDTLSFLTAVLDQGQALLAKLCHSPVPPEELLIERFLASGFLKGSAKRDVRVGGQRFTSGQYVLDWRQRIDLVFEADDGCTWIIEAKPKLNWEAFGQVLAYGHLYEKEHGEPVRRAILCWTTDVEIEFICRDPKFAIKVLVQEAEGLSADGVWFTTPS